MKKLAILAALFIGFGFCFFPETGNNIFTCKAQAAVYEQVHAYHILVPTQEEALKIRKEVISDNRTQTFTNFREAAKKYSTCPSGKDGGDLGWFGKGDMVPEFEKTAFSIKNGEVSEPVKTQFGWHLIYVTSKK